MMRMLVLFSALVGVICSHSVPLRKSMSQEIIVDFVNSEAQTTWKVCEWMFVTRSLQNFIWQILQKRSIYN